MSEDRHQIVFSLEQQEQEKSALEEERERHRIRAERFGTQYKDPAKLPKFADEARKERFRREGFTTGIDLFSEEELAKKAARARKFGLPEERAQPGYAPDPEELKREARAKKFGVQYEKPTAEALKDKADLFEEPKEAPTDMPRRETAIYLYGVDIMSSNDVLSYFDDYGPTLVEWINDSSCCVVFEDAATTRRAIAGCGHPLTAEQLSSAPDSMDQHMADLDAATAMPYLWHKGKDFIKGKDSKGKDTKVALMYRMATDLDQKDPHAEKRSRYLWKGKRQRPGDGQQHHQRGGQRQQQQAYGEEGWQEDDEGYGADGDVEMQQAKRQRGGRKVQRQKQRQLQQEGDIDMDDAEEQEAANTEAAAAAPAAAPAAAGDDDDELADADARDLRELLKQRDAARRAAEEDLPYEEVPQPDGDEEV